MSHISYFKRVPFTVKTAKGSPVVVTRDIPRDAGYTVPYGYARFVAERLARLGVWSDDDPSRFISPYGITEVSYVLPEATFGDVG